MTGQKLDDKIAKARVKATLTYPYYSRALCSMNIKLVDGDIVSCDKNFNVHVGRESVEKYNIEELAFALVHEVSHLLRKHHERAKILERGVSGFDAGLWNRACDFSINNSIKLLSPPSGVIKEPYRELTEWNPLMSPETIYFNEIEAMANDDSKSEQTEKNDSNEDNKNGDGGGGGGGQSNEKGESTGDSGGSGENNEYNNGDGDDGENQDNGCGECVGRGEGLEKPGSDDSMDEGTAEDTITKTATDIKNYAENHGVGNKIGQVPAGILRQAEKILSKPINYMALLRNVISGASSHKRGLYTTTYSRIKRRQADRTIILPEHVAPPETKILAICDTSGSVKKRQLSHMLSQLSYISKLNNTQSFVLFTDTKGTGEVVKLTPFTNLKKYMQGGGGTDMMEPLKKYGGDYDLIFIFSDGYFKCDEKPPILKPVWAIIFDNPRFKPPKWMKTIKQDSGIGRNRN